MKDENIGRGRDTPTPENGSTRPPHPNGGAPERDGRPVRRARHTPEEIARSKGTSPAESVRTPPQSGRIPPQSGRVPPQSGRVPPQGGRVPPQGGRVSPQSGKVPPQGGRIPPQGGRVPPQGGRVSPQGGRTPSQGGRVPPQGGIPSRQGVMPRTGTAKLSRARSVPGSTAGRPGQRRKKRRSGRRSSVRSAIWAIAIALAVGVALLVILIARAKNIENKVRKLIEENEFTEAYRTADDSRSEGLRNLVCDAATDHYLAAGDYKTAYVFAHLYGEDEKVTDAAIDEVVRAGKDGVYGDAFSVAALSENAEKFNTALRTVIKGFTSVRDYFTALDVAGYALGEGEKEKFESSVFAEGLSYYTENMLNDDDVFRFISKYCSPDGQSAVDENSVGEVIDNFIKDGKKAEAFIIASHFGVDTSAVDVGPGDPSVRRIIGTVWPLLTPEQKRSFHSNSVGYYKETFVITDGAVSGTEIRDAVSVDTHEFTTVVMHKDGHVTSIGINGGLPEVAVPADVYGVQAVCGLRHAVILKDDGTCEAFGSNDFGQCDVSDWHDIVEIAAGRFYTLGLKKDGTCVGCGSNRSGQLAIAGFRNVTSVRACDQTSVVLFSDGTVHIAGYKSMGLDRANDLCDVEDLCCGATFIVAKLTDGEYTIVDGTVDGSAGDAAVLKGCRALSGGPASIAYVDEEGNLNYTGDGSPATNKLNGT